jgi:hypothetical protein
MIANNLAWKLSSVLNNTAENPEELLDSYFEEVGEMDILYDTKDGCLIPFTSKQRYPIVDSTIEGTGRMGRTIFKHTMITGRFLEIP